MMLLCGAGASKSIFHLPNRDSGVGFFCAEAGDNSTIRPAATANSVIPRIRFRVNMCAPKSIVLDLCHTTIHQSTRQPAQFAAETSTNAGRAPFEILTFRLCTDHKRK